jgi:murein DD-endopeptidase MepM/ murein hydrolase activator NlpD
VALVLGAPVVVNLYVFVWDKKTSVGAIRERANSPAASLTNPAILPAAPVKQPPLQGGATSAGGSAAATPPGSVDGKVQRGETLGKLLKRNGLSAAETDEVIRALSGKLDFKAIRPGQAFHIERGPDGHVRRFDLIVSKVLTVRAERNQNGELIGMADAAKTRAETQTIGGRIDSSLYAAIKTAAGGKDNNAAVLVDFFVDLFAYDLDFYNDTHDGDTFRVVVEKDLHSGTGELIRYKRILAAEYAGRAGTFRTYAFGNGYFNDQGESVEKTLLKTPLKFQRVTSGFDRARMHPILHTTTAHLGVDYAAPTGTPVWAAANGTITFRAEAGGAGNFVILKHDNGIETHYMHLSKFADGQKVGQRVAAKTVIGYVGSTGMSTGPHLHFGVKQHGQMIDPTKVVSMRGKAIASVEQEAFRAEVARLEEMLASIKIPQR